MKLFNKVAIVGTGLIGGSIGLAIKKRLLAKQVIGVSRRKESITLAKKSGSIDIGSCDMEIIKDADLVILATPVSVILKSAPLIKKIIRPGCIVTDVGSTKEEICRALGKIFPNYIGAHPLAGSEKRGIANANAEIFKDSLCLLTPAKNSNSEALKKIEKLWVSLGARACFLSPRGHDQVISFISHLPHLNAFSLINSVPRQYLKFAAGGLKDTTRIASSDPRLWADIFLSNRKNILKSIKAFQVQAKKIKSAIISKDKHALLAMLKQAKLKRDSL